MISIDKYLKDGKHKEINDFYQKHGVTETARKYNISYVRVYQIVKTFHKRCMAAQNIEFTGLPVRIYYALMRSGIKTRQQLKNYYRDKGIDGLKELKHIGEKSAKIIEQYLGD